MFCLVSCPPFSQDPASPPSFFVCSFRNPPLGLCLKFVDSHPFGLTVSTSVFPRSSVSPFPPFRSFWCEHSLHCIAAWGCQCHRQYNMRPHVPLSFSRRLSFVGVPGAVTSYDIFSSAHFPSFPLFELQPALLATLWPPLSLSFPHPGILLFPPCFFFFFYWRVVVLTCPFSDYALADCELILTFCFPLSCFFFSHRQKHIFFFSSFNFLCPFPVLGLFLWLTFGVSTPLSFFF